MLISGLQAKPELNGKIGVAEAFDDASGRYAVLLEEGNGAFKLKPANLTEAPPKLTGEDGPKQPPLTESEKALQGRVKAIRKGDDMWVMRRMGYSEAENPQHMGLVMSGKSGMMLGSFQSAKLAPTCAEYLKALEPLVTPRARHPLLVSPRALLSPARSNT